jgi:hypothetical protein
MPSDRLREREPLRDLGLAGWAWHQVDQQGHGASAIRLDRSWYTLYQSADRIQESLSILTFALFFDAWPVGHTRPKR